MNNNKKYELMPSDKEGLYRVKALKDFNDVRKATLVVMWNVKATFHMTEIVGFMTMQKSIVLHKFVTMPLLWTMHEFMAMR